MKSLEALAALRERARRQVELRDKGAAKRVVVGMATSGIAAGARTVLRAVVDEVSDRGLSDVVVSQSGAVSRGGLEPVVEVELPGREIITYVHVQPEMVPRIVEESLVGGEPVEEYTLSFYERQNS